MVRHDGQTPNGLSHCRKRRGADIYPIHYRGTEGDGAPCQTGIGNGAVKLLARCRLQHLGIIETGRNAVRVENDSSSHHRSCKRPSTDFVHTADEQLPPRKQAGFGPEIRSVGPFVGV